MVDKKTLNRASTENLLTEIEILKTMKHEHIVELRDFVWDDHYIYLVMEYCSGGDLSKFIKKKKVLPEFVAKYCLQQIASALKFLRENNVSHLDLKPQNILLSSKTSPVLKVRGKMGGGGGGKVRGGVKVRGGGKVKERG